MEPRHEAKKTLLEQLNQTENVVQVAAIAGRELGFDSDTYKSPIFAILDSYDKKLKESKDIDDDHELDLQFDAHLQKLDEILQGGNIDAYTILSRVHDLEEERRFKS